MIKTKRLYLRPFQETDGEALFDYLSKESVVKYEPYDVYSLEEAIKEAKLRMGNKAFYAVCLNESNVLIGNLYFNQEGPSYLKTYTLGFVFNPTYQGFGYATEACNAIIKYGFSELGLHRIVASCNCDNIRSWKLLERIKMRREATRLENVYFKLDQNNQPLWVNSYQYAILSKEFNQQ